MKLSFSIPKKSQTKPPSAPAAVALHRGGDSSDDEDGKQSRVYLKEFDGSKAPEANPVKHVIPPKANEWKRPMKKMKNLDLPHQSDAGENPALQFEVVPASLEDVAASDTMSFGLNLRDPEQNPNPDPITDPILKLREDLQNLPDEVTMEEFEDLPVEEFGRALLSGYGWVEGRGIGRNAKKDVQIYQHAKHIGRGGIGFVDTPLLEASAEVEKGKTEEVAVSNGKEKVFAEGDEVRVIGGKEDGMKGRITELRSKGKVAVVKLSDSRKEVKVDVRDLAEVKGTKRVRESQEENGVSKKEVPWLTSHIRVRIVSKSLKRGKFYLKKGKVVDVVGPMTCDLIMDEGRELVQGVEQGQLETAIPKSGGSVLVLSGRYKGVYGRLVEKDTKKETCVVRDEDTHKMINVRLEQVAEFVGDPSYIGH